MLSQTRPDRPRQWRQEHSFDSFLLLRWPNIGTVQLRSMQKRMEHEGPADWSRKSARRFGKNAGRKMFDWNDLRYFLAIARGGSIGTAAKALGVNQSTVQRRLRALEVALDCSLADRQAGGYQLTAHGQQLLTYAEQVETTVSDRQRSTTARRDWSS